MKKTRIWLIFLLSLFLILCLGGCKPSKKKVESSSYYKTLQKKYDKLDKENKKLKKQVEKNNNVSSDEQMAQSYLEKIARDSLIKLEVGYMENMDDAEVIDEKAAFSYVTELVKGADRTTRYTPEEIEELYAPGYEYILFDENNAVYEMLVYQGDYVVFRDLPDYVFYVKSAQALGDAFMPYRHGYPESKLLHRLADSPLARDRDHHYFDNNVIQEAAIALNKMEKEKSSRDKATAFWKQKKKKNMEKKASEYIFYHHSNQMKMTLYDCFVRIENVDGIPVWFRASENDVNKIKEIFQSDYQKRKKQADKKKDSDDTDKFHYEDMESESGKESNQDAVSDQ